jgi:hypothetical protein
MSQPQQMQLFVENFVYFFAICECCSKKTQCIRVVYEAEALVRSSNVLNGWNWWAS